MSESQPPRKRFKSLANPPQSIQTHDTKLFAPFRALGFVTNHVPFVLQTHSYKGATGGPRVHILTCLGRTWALWEGGKMTLLFVGPNAPEAITWMALDGDAVWISSGDSIRKHIRGKETACITNPLGTTISTIAVFGSQLLALTGDGRHLLVWNALSGELFSTIAFDSDFTSTHILHPATYLNKILIGSSQGAMQLWNIRTQTCIHKFSSERLRDIVGLNSPSAITSLVQSPAIDVVGIGFASGEVSIYDVRVDERLMRVYMDSGGIRSLAFRDDGQPILATASSTGHIALWDLGAGGSLLHIMKGAHDGPIASIEWIPRQPVLVSSGEDNSVKQWFFESPSSPPSLLKFRSGHHSPPHLIRYYGEDGKQLLTAARDRSLRCTSVVRDSRSFELSQGSLLKKATSLSIPLSSLKFPPITAMSFTSARSKDWEDVLSSHTDEAFARTWTVQNKRVGRWSLASFGSVRGKGPPGIVKAVCVTACGNFGLLGSSTGAIHMWNMQSGILRKSFHLGPSPPEVLQKFKSKRDRVVTGIATDALNKCIIISTLDCTVNFFDFHSTRLTHVLTLPSGIDAIALQRDSGLLATICDDFVIRIIDIETYRIVRDLGGFRGRILDITFSPDSRWLIATSLDSTVRTFDIPSGRLIDAFHTSSVATSVAFSPTGDFLATAHVDSVGIYLWANRAQYSEVSFRTVTDGEVTEVSLPSVQGLEDEALEGLDALTIAEQVNVFTTPPQLDGDLVTLTLLPRSRWQTLLNIDTIQLRNKPKEPPKKPEKAPFFLPTLPGVEHRLLAPTSEPDTNKKKSTRRLDETAKGVDSEFYKKLIAEDQAGESEIFFDFIKTLLPAAIDLELRSLVTVVGLRLFIAALTRRLQSHRDFEAVQTILNVFLRIHGDVLVENGELGNSLRVLLDVQQKESSRVLELITSSLGTLGFVRDTL